MHRMGRKRRKLQLKIDRLKEQKGPRKMQAITNYNDQDGQQEETKHKVKRQPALLRIATTADGDAVGATRGLKPMPQYMEQGTYESEDQFLNRISRLSAEARAEANMEDRFGLDFCPAIEPQVMSTQSGAVVVTGTKKKRRGGLTEEERTEARRAKRRERDSRRRSRKKRGSKSHEVDDFEHFQDDVRFGDVVVAPPAFSKRKTKF